MCPVCSNYKSFLRCTAGKGFSPVMWAVLLLFPLLCRSSYWDCFNNLISELTELYGGSLPLCLDVEVCFFLCQMQGLKVLDTFELGSSLSWEVRVYIFAYWKPGIICWRSYLSSNQEKSCEILSSSYVTAYSTHERSSNFVIYIKPTWYQANYILLGTAEWYIWGQNPSWSTLCIW